MKYKQILFAHSGGSQGAKGEGSFDLVTYLKKELPSQIEINYPVIANPEAPTYEMWKKLFDTQFKLIKEPLILVGHSLGGSMLLKYLSEENSTIQIDALFLVDTPFWGEADWNIEDFVLQENHAFKLSKIKHVYLYHSIQDPIVPFEHVNIYKKTFPASTVRVIQGSDHTFANGLRELVNDIKSVLSAS